MKGCHDLPLYLRWHIRLFPRQPDFVVPETGYLRQEEESSANPATDACRLVAISALGAAAPDGIRGWERSGSATGQQPRWEPSGRASSGNVVPVMACTFCGPDEGLDDIRVWDTARLRGSVLDFTFCVTSI